MFKLDNRIEKDSFLVKEFNDFQIRIMDVREVFWVILIPTKINLIELSDLDIEKRNILINFAVELGDFLKSNKEYDKVNIAMLGNVVSQLHLHLVLRKKSDPAWPGPVWGYNFKNKLDEKSKSNRSKLILQFSK
jgi:diadenosine tetraphosphate (Ap4A) HIT family hydrolase